MKIHFNKTSKCGVEEDQRHITLNLQHITNFKVEQSRMNQQDPVMNLQEVSGEASVHALSLQDRRMMTRLGSMGKKKR